MHYLPVCILSFYLSYAITTTGFCFWKYIKESLGYEIRMSGIDKEKQENTDKGN